MFKRDLLFKPKGLLAEGIVTAVKAGDIDKLKELIRAERGSQLIRLQTTGCGKDIMHLAVLSRNLAMVQFVEENFNPRPKNVEEFGLTPLALACYTRCPVEIIIYLIERNGTMGRYDGTPLQFAVLHNWYDLAKALIALEARMGLEPSTKPLRTVAIITGDVEMLQLLLDVPNGTGLTFITQKIEDLTGLEQLAKNASYGLEKKVACFKTLFKLAHPNAYTSDPERYNMNDILKYALLSMYSTSLIPYFIEMERKWETRAPVLSLYDQLSKHDALSVTVLCECGSVAGERKELDVILMNTNYVHHFWREEIEELFENAIKLHDEDQTMEAMLLLENFAKFFKSTTLPWLTHRIKFVAMFAFYGENNFRNHLYQDSFHRAVESMVALYGDTADGIYDMMFEHDHHKYAIALFTILRHCAVLPMRPEELDICRPRSYQDQKNVRSYRLLSWIVHLFGPWKAIQQHFGKPKLELFTLQRFARDVVRESIWQGVKGTNGAERLFLDHLQSLNVPKELNEYLRYCDNSSTDYFLKHWDAVKRVKSLRSNKLPYPFAF